MSNIFHGFQFLFLPSRILSSTGKIYIYQYIRVVLIVASGKSQRQNVAGQRKFNGRIIIVMVSCFGTVSLCIQSNNVITILFQDKSRTGHSASQAFSSESKYRHILGIFPSKLLLWVPLIHYGKYCRIMCPGKL